MRHFQVTIDGNNYLGEFTIKYSVTSSINTYTICNLSGTTTPATGLSYTLMTTDGGPSVETPDGVGNILVEDDDNNCPDIIIPISPGSTPGTGGNNTYYISQTGYSSYQSFCFATWPVTNEITSDAFGRALALNEFVYKTTPTGTTPFNGEGNWYLVATQSSYIYPGGLSNVYWKINNLGEITDVEEFTCGNF
tara:strand:+ start:1379 stop:1957 length:579 start_codon:yes stop_codon:yes gene_type:complete